MIGDLPTLVVADSVAGTPYDSVLISGGRVVSVGFESEIETTGLAVERYRNTHLVAGLGDAHFHPLGFVAAVNGLNLARCANFDHLREALAGATARLGDGEAIAAVRLNDELLHEKRLPTRSDLDAMVSDRPVLIYRYCGHVAVANTAALDLAGVGPETHDPVGGGFDRTDGVPNGILRETAVSVVGDAVAGRAGPISPQSIIDGLNGLVSMGITRLGAIVATDGFCGVDRELDLLLGVADDLPLHMSVLVHAADADDLELAANRIERAGRRLHFLGMKEFTDGALGGRTAALRHPYADGPDGKGISRFDLDRIDPIARRSLELGGSVALHAIGDAACGDTIDYFARLREEGVDARQLRIEHASILTDEDVEKLAATEAVASVQPAFLESETDWLHNRIGTRADITYRFATMANAGIPMAGGSDCPVEPPFPLVGMAAARDRAGMLLHEVVDASQALDMFTSGVSAALREPSPLAVGARADFALIDVNPVTASPAELRAAEVVSTWIDGAPHTMSSIEWT